MLHFHKTNEFIGICFEGGGGCLPIRTTLVNTSTSDHEKHGKVRQHWRQKRKKACVRIKRVKVI
jgi:hypothetical protein